MPQIDLDTSSFTSRLQQLLCIFGGAIFVTLIVYLAPWLFSITFGGAMAGLGGAYISLVRVPQWVDGITAGQGWIALAIVVFASWKPWRVLLGAWLFGGIAALQLRLQAAEVGVPVALLDASPYLITIIVLVIISSDRSRAALNAPAMLGRIFHASG